MASSRLVLPKAVTVSTETLIAGHERLKERILSFLEGDRDGQLEALREAYITMKTFELICEPAVPPCD